MSVNTKNNLTWEEYITEDAVKIHDIVLPLNKNNKAELLLCSDLHIGNPVYNQTKIPLKVLTKETEILSSNETMRILSLGDDMEMISLRPKSHLAHGRVPLMKEEAETYLNIWKNNLWQIIGKVSGNHEFRATLELSKLGLDSLGIPIIDKEIMKNNPNCILAEPERGLILRIKVGDSTYYGYIAHGSGTSITEEYHLKRVLNNILPNIDFVALGHIHKSFSNNYPVLNIPSVGISPIKKNRIGVRSGTCVPYLAYAEKNVYPCSQLGNMLLTFNTDKIIIETDNVIQKSLIGD